MIMKLALFVALMLIFCAPLAHSQVDDPCRGKVAII
jgi:hypothetical protein